MGVRQFNNSLKSIMGNPHINRRRGVLRHLAWQWRKALNLFPVEQRISNSRIVAAHRRCGVSALINSQELYNYNNMKLLQYLLREGGVFFDVGANIGSYTLIAAESQKAWVFAFEPHPGTCRLLKANVELNGRTNVTVLDVALTSADSAGMITDEVGSAMNHLVYGQAQSGVPVVCRRAETVCRDHGVVPNYVKVDVEGFEYDVLEGFGPYLSQVELVLVEINGLSELRSTGAKGIHTLLTANGFVGPHFCDYDRLTLQPEPVGHEDALYVGPALLTWLTAEGFRCSGRT